MELRCGKKNAFSWFFQYEIFYLNLKLEIVLTQVKLLFTPLSTHQTAQKTKKTKKLHYVTLSKCTVTTERSLNNLKEKEMRFFETVLTVELRSFQETVLPEEIFTKLFNR